MYGGTITSVLVNVPGESASVMTALEGHKMAQGELILS
jgi:putative tricarboxylic transport membrane protein